MEERETLAHETVQARRAGGQVNGMMTMRNGIIISIPSSPSRNDVHVDKVGVPPS